MMNANDKAKTWKKNTFLINKTKFFRRIGNQNGRKIKAWNLESRNIHDDNIMILKHDECFKQSNFLAYQEMFVLYRSLKNVCKLIY